MGFYSQEFILSERVLSFKLLIGQEELMNKILRNSVIIMGRKKKKNSSIKN